MQGLSNEGQQLVADLAARHGVSQDAVVHLLYAVSNGGGFQAQFNHPDLGGMGQWQQGGMIMVGDMFNQSLKYRVDALCNDVAHGLATLSPFTPPPQHSQTGTGTGFGYGSRWPAELGVPGSSGSQNAMHYAVFTGMRRLAIEHNGQVTVYDTLDHQIGGVSQAQGGGQTLAFTSQYGLVRLIDLPIVTMPGAGAMNSPEPAQDWSQPQSFQADPVQPAPFPPEPMAAQPIAHDADDIFTRLERLADLHGRAILSDSEFAAKKAELLARL